MTIGQPNLYDCANDDKARRPLPSPYLNVTLVLGSPFEGTKTCSTCTSGDGLPMHSELKLSPSRGVGADVWHTATYSCPPGCKCSKKPKNASLRFWKLCNAAGFLDTYPSTLVYKYSNISPPSRITVSTKFIYIATYNKYVSDSMHQYDRHDSFKTNNSPWVCLLQA